MKPEYKELIYLEEAFCGNLCGLSVIDMLSTYQNVTKYMIQRSANKEILPSERYLQDSFCFALRKGDTILKNELDKAIKAMMADGTLKKLTKEYITELKDDA